jgi:hypothetical protein
MLDIREQKRNHYVEVTAGFFHSVLYYQWAILTEKILRSEEKDKG